MTLKTRKGMIIFFAGAFAALFGGCAPQEAKSGDGQASEQDRGTPEAYVKENEEKKYTETRDNGTEKKPEASEKPNEAQNSNGGNDSGPIDAAGLFDSANLFGYVKDVSDTGFSLVAGQNSVSGDGDVSSIAAQGAEKNSDIVQITCGGDVDFQTLTMDLSTQTSVSLTETGQEELEEGSEILLFGTCEDSSHWIASKVVIVRWQ